MESTTSPRADGMAALVALDPAPPTVVAAVAPPVPTFRPRSGALATARRRGPILVGTIIAGSVAAALAVAPGRDRTLAALTGTAGPASAARFEVARSTIALTVPAAGALESSRNLDATSQVEGQTTIIYLRTEGEQVKAGDLVCELDSATFRDNLATEIIVVEQAEATYKSAVTTRELAEHAVREYIGGTYPQELEVAKNAQSVAESTLKQAIDKFEWSALMVEKGFIPATQHVADALAKRGAEVGLAKTKTRLHVLEINKKKMLTELRGAVDKARTDELAKRVTLEVEKTKQKKLETQIARCTLRAGKDGMVIHANENMPPGATQPQIMEGATVRERQKIFSLPDITAMRVRAKVHESLVTKIEPGQPAKIRVDALPGQTFHGTVAKIQPIADPVDQNSGSESRTYTALVTLEDPTAVIRPGMVAQVEVLVGRAEDVLTVPIHSVLQFHGENQVFIVRPDGIERRKVDVGATDDKMIEIRDGLSEGETVAFRPLDLMSDDEKKAAFLLGKAEDEPGDDDWSEILAGGKTAPAN